VFVDITTTASIAAHFAALQPQVEPRQQPLCPPETNSTDGVAATAIDHYFSRTSQNQSGLITGKATNQAEATMTQSLTERYREPMTAVVSCYDRIVMTGTLPGACYACGMASFLYSRGVRIFDYARFAEPLRVRIRVRAQAVCAEAGIQIERINTPHIREKRVVACSHAGANRSDWCWCSWQWKPAALSARARQDSSWSTTKPPMSTPSKNFRRFHLVRLSLTLLVPTT